MEFHTQHVPTADDLLVANFCKIGGSKSLDILEAYNICGKRTTNSLYKAAFNTDNIDMEGYSSAYFDHITTFKALHHLTFTKGGACMHYF